MGNVTLTRRNQVYIIKEFLADKLIDLHDISPGDLKTHTKVFLNGEWLGITDQPRRLYLALKRMKYNGDLDQMVSIIHEIKSDIESKEIRVCCDGGRIYRPYFVVENNTVKLTKENINTIILKGKSSAATSANWNEFLIKNKGLIEYLDTDEMVNSMIAMFPSDVEKMRQRQIDTAKIIQQIKIDDIHSIANRYDDFVYVNYTHCELHPSMMIGAVVANIPFSNHNQGPRNIFQYSQARQAMGIYASNYRDRLDISYILYYAQRPLVTTRLVKYINTDMLPTGENAVVAIACYTGFNVDDSVIISQSAIDRGLYITKYVKKYITTIQKNQSTSQDDVFTKPDRSKVAGMRHGSYDKLNDQGYVPEETAIENGDIIMAKISPIQPIGTSDKTFKDNSEQYKSHVPGVVDRVWTEIYNHEGYEMRKMRVRSERIPIIGDKFCLRETAEVLTTDGWINITKITKDHKVATLVDNAYLEYVNPIDVYNFKYKGDMYKLISQQVDLDVTMDHELYVKRRDKTEFELIPAKEVKGKRVQFKKDCMTKLKDIKYKNITHNGETKQYNMDAFLELLGLFISDGYTTTSTKGESFYVEFAFSKERKITLLQNTCKTLGVHLMSYKDETATLNTLKLGSKHRIHDSHLTSHLQQYSVGALNKYLPTYVWDLSNRQARILLEALVCGDGSQNNNRSKCYYTSSRQLADDVMKLCIHAGWSGSIKTVREEGSTWNIEGRTGQINADALSVRINMTKNTPQINHGHIKMQNGQTETVYEYDGNVYCLEVPSHVFMIRENNKNVWIGNCSRH